MTAHHLKCAKSADDKLWIYFEWPNSGSSQYVWPTKSSIYCAWGCIYMKLRGSLHTSQISHLPLYPSLWLLVPGLSSQFLPLFPVQPAFNVSRGRQDLWEMATTFCKLWEPLKLLIWQFDASTTHNLIALRPYCHKCPAPVILCE